MRARYGHGSMSDLFTNEEFEQAETLDKKMSALIAAAHWNGMREGQAQAEAKAAAQAHEEQIIELGRIFRTAAVLLDEASRREDDGD